MSCSVDVVGVGVFDCDWIRVLGGVPEMIVELRNCSLEIGHIGTRRDIALELLEDSLDALKKAMISFSESLCNTLQNAMIGFVNSMCGALGPTWATVNGAIDQPIKKSRRQKNIERVAQEAERKQRFAKGSHWI